MVASAVVASSVVAPAIVVANLVVAALVASVVSSGELVVVGAESVVDFGASA